MIWSPRVEFSSQVWSHVSNSICNTTCITNVLIWLPLWGQHIYWSVTVRTTLLPRSNVKWYKTPTTKPHPYSGLYLWASWTWSLVWFLSSSQLMWLGYYTCSTFFFFGNKLLSYAWRMVGWMILSTYPISPYLLQGYLLVWLS